MPVPPAAKPPGMTKARCGAAIAGKSGTYRSIDLNQGAEIEHPQY
jgi:hypothetical protein